jgi:hypothetical protein
MNIIFLQGFSETQNTIINMLVVNAMVFVSFVIWTSCIIFISQFKITKNTPAKNVVESYFYGIIFSKFNGTALENMKTNVLHCNCKDLINVVTHINEDQIYQSIVKQPSHEVRARVSLL